MSQCAIGRACERSAGAATFPAHRSASFTGLPHTVPLCSCDFLTGSAQDALRSRAGFKGKVMAPDLRANEGLHTRIFSYLVSIGTCVILNFLYT